MRQTITQRTWIIHLLGFIGVFFALFFLLAVQVVVDDTKKPFSLASFLQLNTWQRIATAIGTRKGTSLNEYYALQDGKVYTIINGQKTQFSATPVLPIDNSIVVTGQKDKFAYHNKEGGLCVVYQNDAQKSWCIPLTNTENAHLDVIHWNAEGTQLYLATLDGSWTIWQLDVNTQQKTAVQKDIQFAQPTLTKSYEPISSLLIYPTCTQTQKCWFESYDINKHIVVGEIPAIEDEHEGSLLSALAFSFFSPKNNILAYQKVTPAGVPYRFLTIHHNGGGNDQKPLLLQAVRLESNPMLPLQFVQYFAQNNLLVFRGEHVGQNLYELFSLAADEATLRLLGKFKDDEAFVPLNTTDLFGHDSMIQSAVTGKTQSSTENLLEAR